MVIHTKSKSQRSTISMMNNSVHSSLRSMDDEGQQQANTTSTSANSLLAVPINDDNGDDATNITNITSTTNETPVISNCSRGLESSSLCPSLDDTSITTPTINNLSNPPSRPRPKPTNRGVEDLLLTYKSQMSMHDTTRLDVETSLVVILFIAGFTASIYSSLSCKFIKCQIGFTPTNINIEEMYMNIGLWSFESVLSTGESSCLRYPADFSADFIQGRIIWSVSRVIGMMNMILGWISIVIICMGNSRLEQFSCFAWARRYWLFWTFATSFILVLSEAINLFVFRKISPCSSDDVWVDLDGGYRTAESCSFGLGAYSSVVALCIYFITMLIMFRRHSARGILKRNLSTSAHNPTDDVSQSLLLNHRDSSATERSFGKSSGKSP